MKHKTLLLACMITGCLLAGCTSAAHTTPDPTINETSDIPDTKETSAPAASAIPIKFTDADVEKLDPTSALTEPRSIIVEKELNHYTVEIYQKPTDQENVFASIRTDTGIVEVGMAGSSAYLSPDDYSIKELQMMNRSLLKIAGLCGANCSQTTYIQLDVEPPIALRINAHTAESDLDGDHNNEIVATTGTAPQTTIYKIIDDKFKFVDLNEAMNTQVVFYNSESNSFKAEIPHGMLTTWKLEGYELILLPE